MTLRDDREGAADLVVCEVLLQLVNQRAQRLLIGVAAVDEAQRTELELQTLLTILLQHGQSHAAPISSGRSAFMVKQQQQ